MHLSNGDVSISLDPERGGRLSSLLVHGHELLVAREQLVADDPALPLLWGAYPMTPWAGRVRQAQFDFDGEQHQVRIDPGSGPISDHSIHGVGFVQPWDRVDEQTLSLQLDGHWPLGGSVTHQVQLAEDSLTLTLCVTAGARAMPAMVGWHPWFRRVLSPAAQPVRLCFEADSMYELDEDAIPTGRLVPVPDGPWDNCFVGVTSPITLTWPGQLRLTLSSDCEHWVVYDQPDHAICVEPQSAAPDVFNHAPNSLDQRLEPGQSLTRSFTLSWDVLVESR